VEGIHPTTESIRVAAVLEPKFKFFIANINRDDLTTFGGLIKAGKVTSVIDRRYPLTQTADAIAYVEEGHARAKVIISVQ
jgi:NADPH:quinone reductase-like Zn-dependent oxidoreductase